MTAAEPATLAAALGYAARGWAVIPLHSPRGDGCSCGRDCGSVGKHPRTEHGLKDATCDAATIRGWFARWSDANVGIATGQASGLVCLDVDPRHGGHESLAALEAEFERLPFTIESATGGGGRHILFQHPGGGVGNRTGIRPGLDVKGDAALIVAPPSRHASGGVYQWRTMRAPSEIPLEPLPEWLLTLLTTPRPAPAPLVTAAATGTGHGNGHGDATENLRRRARGLAASFAGVGEGQRNDGAFELGCGLAGLVGPHGEALSENDILGFVESWNRRCTPPLPDGELRKVVRSAVSKPRTPKPAAAAPKKAAKPKPPPEPPMPWQPFPTELLPETPRQFCVATADALGCDVSMVALPMLATLAGAVGLSREVRLKATWSEPAILWAAVVAKSGSLKSPAHDAAIAPLRRLQSDMMRDFQRQMTEYLKDQARFERAKHNYKTTKGSVGEPPEAPTPPKCKRVVTKDATIEALGSLLADSPKGILIERDELSAFIGGLGQYKKPGSGDEAAMLELWRGGPLISDRKTTGSVFVPHAAASICGSIQPGIAAAIFSGERTESGMLARFLLAAPPPRRKRWTERVTSRATREAYALLVRDLASLPMGDGEHGPEPLPLALSPEAREHWSAWYDRHADAIADSATDGDAAALAKLEAYGARLALLFQLCDDPAATTVGDDAMRRGCSLASWFVNEARRCYAVMHEPDEAHATRRLVEWIAARDGVTTPRDLSRGPRQYRGDADAAEQALVELVAAGLGTWETLPASPGGGPAPRQFRLTGAATKPPDSDPPGDKTPETLDENGVLSPVAVSPVCDDAPPDLYADCPEANAGMTI